MNYEMGWESAALYPQQWEKSLQRNHPHAAQQKSFDKDTDAIGTARQMQVRRCSILQSLPATVCSRMMEQRSAHGYASVRPE